MNTARSESRGPFSTSQVSCNLARPGSWRPRSALRTVPWPRISWRKSPRPLRMAPKNWRCNDRLTWCCWTWNFMMRGGLEFYDWGWHWGWHVVKTQLLARCTGWFFSGRIPVVFKVLLHTPRLLDLIQKVRWESVRSITRCLRWCFSCFLPIESQLHSTHQWIGLRENLQESPIFNGKIYGFRLKFSFKTNPLNTFHPGKAMQSHEVEGSHGFLDDFVVGLRARGSQLCPRARGHHRWGPEWCWGGATWGSSWVLGGKNGYEKMVQRASEELFS